MVTFCIWSLLYGGPGGQNTTALQKYKNIIENRTLQNTTDIKSNINTTKLYKHNIIENTIYEKQYCRNDNNIIEKNTKMA